MITSPAEAYRATLNPKTGAVRIYYNDKNVHDEEKIYEFLPDGSATSRSCAWGLKSACPKGTFSDLMLNLPKTGDLNSKIAQKMAREYDGTIRNKTYTL